MADLQKQSRMKKSRKLQLPIDLELQLFDSMVVLILLYGSEVTGFEKSEVLETLCPQFNKTILNVRRQSLMLFIYGKIGRYPINISSKTR